MKLTKRESDLLRRALDKASAPAEADTAAKALIASLRARGINGYDFLRVDGAKPVSGQPEDATRPPEPTSQPPFGGFSGWPNQWGNAEAQASAEAQAQAWQNYQAGMQNDPQVAAAWNRYREESARATQAAQAEANKRENIFKRLLSQLWALLKK